MPLVAGIPDPAEYPVNITTKPSVLKAGKPVDIRFQIADPKTGKAVTAFETIHEKLFHMFIVSQDLKFFVHDHPLKADDSSFHLTTTLPKPGMYRVLSDFYPHGGTPQLVARSLIVPGGSITPGARIVPVLSAQKGQNLDVALTLDPPQPITGMKTLLFFKLAPGDGMELYLGAWGHMMAVSQDLVDMIHTHPFLSDGSANTQFNMIFPRPGVYRVWVQFQRRGVVNTVAFNVPVTELK